MVPETMTERSARSGFPSSRSASRVRRTPRRMAPGRENFREIHCASSRKAWSLSESPAEALPLRTEGLKFSGERLPEVTEALDDLRGRPLKEGGVVETRVQARELCFLVLELFLHLLEATREGFLGRDGKDDLHAVHALLEATGRALQVFRDAGQSLHDCTKARIQIAGIEGDTLVHRNPEVALHFADARDELLQMGRVGDGLGIFKRPVQPARGRKKGIRCELFCQVFRHEGNEGMEELQCLLEHEQRHA